MIITGITKKTVTRSKESGHVFHLSLVLHVTPTSSVVYNYKTVKTSMHYLEKTLVHYLVKTFSHYFDKTLLHYYETTLSHYYEN